MTLSSIRLMACYAQSHAAARANPSLPFGSRTRLHQFFFFLIILNFMIMKRSFDGIVCKINEYGYFREENVIIIPENLLHPQRSVGYVPEYFPKH